jgi:hypothetical protein
MKENKEPAKHPHEAWPEQRLSEAVQRDCDRIFLAHHFLIYSHQY